MLRFYWAKPLPPNVSAHWRIVLGSRCDHNDSSLRRLALPAALQRRRDERARLAARREGARHLRRV